MTTVQIIRNGRLWIAHLPTAFGHMEFLCGEGNEPDLKSIKLVEQFFSGATDHLAAIRRSAFKMPLLWRPIRLAINNDGRLAVQFKNRITGRQDGMYFADEHSTFRTKRSDVTVNEVDTKRLVERFDGGTAEKPGRGKL